MDARFQHPFSAIVAGPSGAGKTHFVSNFIKFRDVMCTMPFKNIIWFYDEWQPLYESDDMPITFRQGLPDIQNDNQEPQLIIIDDLMRETNERIVDMFTKGCHHKNMSVFFITQNLFHQGKGQRDISLNASYIILFKNPRDRAQIQHLARQVCPENVKFVQESFHDATQNAHSYLLIDLKQNTPDLFRFRTSIFPEDKECVVYTPKKGNKYDGSMKDYVILQ